jgi:sec-independent protein translocase protein TatA
MRESNRRQSRLFQEALMFRQFGIEELLIILVIVILLFGVGRISKVAGEMGKGIRAFKKGLSGEDEEEEKPADQADTPKE